MQFGFQFAPYFEFDALLSAARRAYDKAGNLAWAAFRGSGGGRPDNLAKLLKRCECIPKELADRLKQSWVKIGSRLKDFRDCTQHFASTDIGGCSIRMEKLDAGIWRAVAPIPDNPEAKSRSRFTYTCRLDALTYGWEVTNEVACLASALRSAISE